MRLPSYLNQILPFSRLQPRRPIFCPKGEMKLKLIKSNFDSRLQVSKMLFVLLSVLQFFLFCFSFLGHLMSSSESCIDTYQLLVNCITALVISSRNQFVLQINVACDNVVFQHCSATWLFLNRKRRCNKYEIHSRKGSSNRNNEEDKTNVSMLTVSRKELCEKPGKFSFVEFTQLHQIFSISSFCARKVSQNGMKIIAHSPKFNAFKKSQSKWRKRMEMSSSEGEETQPEKVGFLMRSKCILLLFSNRIISFFTTLSLSRGFHKKTKGHVHCTNSTFFRFQFF